LPDDRLATRRFCNTAAVRCDWQFEVPLSSGSCAPEAIGDAIARV
jgi:hypothetical protein